MLRFTYVLAILLVCNSCVMAQDANYWSSNYSAGGFLTPGAVIAFNKDSGVFFYNPALLAFSNKTTASITGNVYQYESINIRNGIGSGLNLSSKGASIIPQMVSGVIALKRKRPFSLAYALIRNPVSGFQTTQRKDAKVNVLNDSYSPGPETFIGQYTAQNTITETSGQLSAGFTISPRFSAGFSMIAQIRRQTYDVDYSIRAIVNGDSNTLFPTISSSLEHYLNSNTHIGMLFRAGLAYNADRHHLGLLFSSPMLHIGGKATLLSDNEIDNMQLSDNLQFNLLANTRQTGLRTRYKTPFSIGLGYAYDYSNNGQVYLAAEYFTKLSQYNIVTPRNTYFIRPDTGNINDATSSLLQFKDAHKAVLNVALGVSFPLTPAVQGYCSFRTDFTYTGDHVYKDDDGYTSNTSAWNNYHLQLGANFRKRKFNLRPGLLFSYGATRKYMQALNFDNSSEDNYLIGDQHPTKASRFSAGLMLSYIHNL